MFIKFEKDDAAEKFIQLDGQLTMEGRLLKINFKMKRMRVMEDKDCWFCFDNSTIDKDLIVDSSFKHFYIALPKGPVCDAHFLIVPKKHIAHSLELNEEMEEEFNLIKTKLVEYIATLKMDYLLFERNIAFKFAKAAHMNVQFIGLQKVDLQLDERIRKLLNGKSNEFIEMPREMELREELCDDPTRHFFYVEVPGLRTAKGR